MRLFLSAIMLGFIPAALHARDLTVTDQNGLIRAYSEDAGNQKILVKLGASGKDISPVIKNIDGTLPDIAGVRQPDGTWLFEGAQQGTWSVVGVSSDISLVEVRLIIGGKGSEE